MKVIFLDIDGVLNVIPMHCGGHDEFGGIFHPHFVENLRSIIDSTGAKIVLSSTWRMSGIDKNRAMWKHRNLPGELIDVTPIEYFLPDWFKGDYDNNESFPRGGEIKFWLDENPVDAYVIIDDDTDMLTEQLPFFVQTSGSEDQDSVEGYGLTKACTEKCIAILNA